VSDNRPKPDEVPPDEVPLDPAAGFPRRDGETEKQFLKRFGEHLRLLRRAHDPGLDGKPPTVGLA
jgi:hypothetical protein